MKKRSIDLETMISNNSDSAYEALQLYKSKINRLKVKYNNNNNNNNQNNNNHLLELLTLCSISSVNFLKYGYESSADEMGKLFIEILEESKCDLTPEIRNLLNNIDSAYTINSISRSNFLKDCLKYSVQVGSRVYGDPLLHKRLAENLWQIGQRIPSIKHFALGEAPELYWQQIQETLPNQEQNNERNQLVTIAILYFLSYENLRDANTLLEFYHKSYSTDDKLIEFCDRLMLTSERDAAPLFKTLVSIYKPYLEFDPITFSLLQGPIAKNIFRIETPPSMFSMIQNLLST